MIKNIVFDMGKVLVGYDAMPVCSHYIKDPQDCSKVCTAVFVSPEWVLLDLGVISDEEALERIKKRLPMRLHEAAALCLRDWDQYNMWPIQEMEPLLRELKAKGFGLYVCSNAAIRLTKMYRLVFPAVECLDGLLFSAEVNCIKPQKEMYEHFFSRFGLKPEECFFIDDLRMNVEGAKKCGMDGYCFEDGDIGKLRAVLTQLE